MRHDIVRNRGSWLPRAQVDYFKAFLQLKPYGTINQSHVRLLSPAQDLACNSGIYTFDVVRDGKPQKVGV